MPVVSLVQGSLLSVIASGSIFATSENIHQPRHPLSHLLDIPDELEPLGS